MSKGLPKNYTFNTAAKTITLTDVTTVRLDKLALITDVTTNKIIYNFADSTVATATVATNVITLSALQGGEANGDKLRIDYDVESSDTAAFADTTQPVSAATLPLPTGASTSALQTTGNSSLSSIDTKTPALGQALAAASTPVVLTAAQITTLTPPAAITGFATETTLGTRLSESDFDTKTGSLTETAPASDTASSGLNGRLQRIAQRITSLITALGSPFQAGGSIGNTAFGVNNAAGASAVNVQDGGNSLTVDAPVGTPAFVRLSDGTAAIATLPVSAASLPLPSGAATSALQTTQDTSINTLLKPASTLAAVTTVSAVTAITNALPAGTNLIGKVGIDQTTPGTTNRVDIGTVNSVAPAFGTGVRGATVQRVTVATDDLVPVSAASLPLPAGAATSALQTTQDTSINTLLKPASTLAAVTTVATVTNLSQLGGAAVSMNTGVRDAGTQRVTIATNDSVPVTGTITAVTAITNALPAGTNLIGKVGIDQTTPGTTNAVVVTANGVISTANSSAAALGISGVFTGTSEDATEYADIRVSVFSDQASATDGLQIQQSSNGTNWDIVDSYSIPASTGKNFSIGVSAKFFRIVYTNGGVAQTVFRLQAKLQKTYTKSSSVRPQDARTNDNDMEEQLGYNMVYNGTSWDRVRGTTANGIAVDVTRNAALVAGTALIGKVGIDQTTPGTTNAVQDIPATSGGLLKFHLVSAATTNATNVKASAGQVYAITAFNLNAAARYLKLHNTAGTPTAGTGVTDTFLIPGNTAGAGLVLNIDKGIVFSTGIAFTLVTGIADTDATAVALNEIVLNIYYK